MNTLIHIGSRKKVNPAEVVLFVADINYTTVYFENGEKALLSTNLKKIEDRFAETKHFFRPNRAYLINLNFAEFHEERSELNIQNQHFINVSRRKKPLLIEFLNK